MPHHVGQHLAFAIRHPPDDRLVFSRCRRYWASSKADRMMFTSFRRAALAVVKLVLHVLPLRRHARGDRMLRDRGRLPASPIVCRAPSAGPGLAPRALSAPASSRYRLAPKAGAAPQQADHLFVFQPAGEAVVGRMHQHDRSATGHILFKSRLHRRRPHLAIIVEHDALILLELRIPRSPLRCGRTLRGVFDSVTEKPPLRFSSATRNSFPIFQSWLFCPPITSTEIA